MMGYKIRNLKIFTSISLENLVPEDNFYRQVEKCVDLSFVRDLASHLYSAFGRPSIDPVVFFKLQLIAFFEGFRSERLLMETVNLNMAHRWFTGYDLDEAAPDHSSLSKIRERYGMEILQQFFEKIVELCVEAGLVWGEELYFDSTKVDAAPMRSQGGGCVVLGYRDNYIVDGGKSRIILSALVAPASIMDNTPLFGYAGLDMFKGGC